MSQLHTQLILLFASVILAAFTLSATAATLAIGDAAPELKASKWVKGGEVSKLEADKTYVVEFWATWCGPCRDSIPHLTEMAHKFPNVTFIGMDVWERGAGKDAAVATFVEKMGDKMDYHVAMDTDDTFMAKNWMDAAGQDGIPMAFLVQAGKVIWIGHPMDGLEKTLKEVAAGKYDIEKARQRGAAKKKLEAFVEKAIKGGDEAELLKEGKELEALDQQLGGIRPDDGKFETQEALRGAKFYVAMQAYLEAVMTGKDDAGIAKLEAAAKAVAPKDTDFDAIKKQLQQMADRAKGGQQAEAIFKKYAAAVGENGDKEKAAALAKQIDDLNIKDPVVLNKFAWDILTAENIKQRDLPLATKLAKAAVDASDSKESAILDTYARALFASGKTAEAVEIETKAVANCKDDSIKDELQTTLIKYQAALMAATEAPPNGVVATVPASTTYPELKNPIRFEIQELRATPVIDADHPDCKDNKYGFEGGTVVKVDGVYHLFPTEMAGDPFWVKMRIAHWTSTDGIKWERKSTIKETSGEPRAKTGLPYESFWSPMMIFNEADKRWELFHVAYDIGGATGGRIWRATSTAQGRAGIAGPYKDFGIIMQPDAESQKWEGGQGVDSFYPYQVKDRWLAFYGSHGGAPGWQVGLAEAPALAGPWKRCVSGNPCTFEPAFIENPIVTRIGDLYVAVYDSDVVNPPDFSYHKEKTSVGYTTSTDGIHWAKGGRILVQPPGPANWSVDIRTPLGLIDEGNDTFTLFYTAQNKKGFWPLSMIKLKMVKETQ